MSTTWAVVAAAGIGSVLTGVFTLAVGVLQSRRRDRNAAVAAKVEVYTKTLAVAGLLAHRAHSLHIMMRSKSGVQESLAALFGLTRPIDILELDALFRRDLEPLYDVWARAWVVGSQAAISAINDIVRIGAETLASATVRGEARGSAARFALGEKWTDDQIAAWGKKVEELAAARKRLAEVARKESGVEVANVWAGEGPTI